MPPKGKARPIGVSGNCVRTRLCLPMIFWSHFITHFSFWKIPYSDMKLYIIWYSLEYMKNNLRIKRKENEFIEDH